MHYLYTPDTPIYTLYTPIYAYIRYFEQVLCMMVLGGCVNYMAADVHRYYNYVVLCMIVITNTFNPIGFMPAFFITTFIFVTFCILTGSPLASTHEVDFAEDDVGKVFRCVREGGGI